MTEFLSNIWTFFCGGIWKTYTGRTETENGYLAELR